jgi:hypothetical protein
MNHKVLIASALALSLAACGGTQSSADNAADRLDNAAAQSTPEAAVVLENQADAIRDNDSAAPAGAPGSEVQQAMDKAGAAQTAPLANDTQVAPPSRQAMPTGAEKGAPPPKTEPKN